MLEKELKKLTLKKVFRKNKISQSSGKKYQSVSLITAEHGDNVWINGFGNYITDSWKDGDIVEAYVWEEEYNGKIGIKFDVQKKQMSDRLSELEARIAKLEEAMKATAMPTLPLN